MLPFFGPGLSKIKLLDQTTMLNSLIRSFKQPAARAPWVTLGLLLAWSAGAQTKSPPMPKLNTPAELAAELAGTGPDEQLLANPERPPLKRIAKNEKLLVGTWRSVESDEHKAPPGSIFFQPNDAILIAPDGYRPIIGTWEADAHNVRFTTKQQGDALIGYTLSKDHKLLTLHFENQMVQTFFRQPTLERKNP